MWDACAGKQYRMMSLEERIFAVSRLVSVAICKQEYRQLGLNLLQIWLKMVHCPFQKKKFLVYPSILRPTDEPVVRSTGQGIKFKTLAGKYKHRGNMTSRSAHTRKNSYLAFVGVCCRSPPFSHYCLSAITVMVFPARGKSVSSQLYTCVQSWRMSAHPSS